MANLEVVTAKNLVDYIIDFESGNLDSQDSLRLFSYLVKTGSAWTLQGVYGRTAKALIEEGYLDMQGNILKEME